MRQISSIILSLAFIIGCLPSQVGKSKTNNQIKPDGLFTEYYESGQKKEGTNYKDGKKWLRD